MLSEAVRQFCN